MKLRFVLTLEEKGAEETSPLSSVWLTDRCAVGGGIDGTVFGIENVLGRHLDGLVDEKQTRVPLNLESLYTATGASKGLIYT